MNPRGPFIFTVLVTVLLGAGTAAFRHLEYRVPLSPGQQQTVWQIEAKVDFIADGDEAQIVLALPPAQAGFRFASEHTASPGYGFVIEPEGDQRRARWSRRQASGEQTLFYKLDVIADRSAEPPTSEAPDTPDNEPWDEPYRTAAQSLLEAALPLSADEYTLAQQLIQQSQRVPADQNVSLLREQYAEAELLAKLLRQAQAPARIVQALVLEDRRRRQPLTPLVQVWHNDSWALFDPVRGPVTDRSSLLLWQSEQPAVLDVTGGTRSRVSFSMISQARPALAVATQAVQSPLMSLYSLPIAEQSMFKLIMLLPVGALVVVLMRLVIGVKTAGTFMPVLIAMAFLQTELLPGLVSFILVVTLGLILRSFLSHLNLLLVARIATLVIVVIGIISVFSVISYRLGLIGGLTITFFPMIILAWTIERMSILWEEEGPKEVLIQGGGSLLVATLAYLLMNQPLVRHLAFNFPELHLCVLAAILLLGRYTGYRLSEVVRFSGMRT